MPGFSPRKGCREVATSSLCTLNSTEGFFSCQGASQRGQLDTVTLWKTISRHLLNTPKTFSLSYFEFTKGKCNFSHRKRGFVPFSVQALGPARLTWGQRRLSPRTASPGRSAFPAVLQRPSHRPPGRAPRTASTHHPPASTPAAPAPGGVSSPPPPHGGHWRRVARPCSQPILQGGAVIGGRGRGSPGGTAPPKGLRRAAAGVARPGQRADSPERPSGCRESERLPGGRAGPRPCCTLPALPLVFLDWACHLLCSPEDRF
ncbi:uncharacterized protein LOC115070933 [Nannospalax galili]|uniref:uncharacterized protein LOC115070933 n=1 Tax=Nannospalax galili TaxID=1026970 RepID=UPI00111C2723|nr:uncharacterized protein LOC115070933 [Nannospalax galili]